MGACQSKPPPSVALGKSYQSKHALLDIERVESQNILGSTVLEYAVPTGCICFAEDEQVDLVDGISKGARGLEIYRACLPDGKIVVAKVLVPSEVKGNPEYDEAFDTELRCLCMMEHPHIISFFGYQELIVDSRLQRRMFLEFCVESVRTRTQHAFYDDTHRLLYPDVLSYCLQIANALEFLHGSSVVHRNISSGNIFLKLQETGLAGMSSRHLGSMLDSGNALSERTFTSTMSVPTRRPLEVKLSDFGYCKTLKDDERARTLVGTVHYVCPEMFKREEYDFACDIWSFGAVIFEMLTGHRPLKDKAHAYIQNKVSAGKFPKSETLAPKTFQPAEKIMRQCLSLDPNRRPTASTLVSLFDSLAREQAAL